MPRKKKVPTARAPEHQHTAGDLLNAYTGWRAKLPADPPEHFAAEAAPHEPQEATTVPLATNGDIWWTPPPTQGTRLIWNPGERTTRRYVITLAGPRREPNPPSRRGEFDMDA